MATIRKNLIVDSRDRTNGTSSSFYISFPQPIRVSNFKLTRTIIKSTWYVVNASNFSIDFAETDAIDTSESSFSISPGNYTSSQIEVALKAGFDGASAANGNARTYTVTIDTTTGLTKITGSAGNFNILFSSGTNTATTLADVIGFVVSDTGAGADHTSTEIVELGGKDKIFLKSNTLCPGDDSGFITSSNDGHVVGVIPLSAASGDVQADIYVEDPMYVYSTSTISYCDFYLTYSGNVAVDLNGSEWYFTASLLLSK